MEPAREPAPTPTPEEPVLTREPLLPGRPPGPNPRHWLNLLSLAVLIVLGFAGLQAWRAQPISPAATPTPTLRPAPTPPTPAPTLPAGQGWVPAGPSWASEIVFAPSAPSRGYVCGVPSPSPTDQRGPIALGVSDDSGATWQRLATPASGMTCALTVNPTNPLDVVIQVFPCAPCREPPPAVLIRSRDGGRSWSPLSLPPGTDLTAMSLTNYTWAWMGGTLFVAPYDARSQTWRLLAVSVDGGPLAWVLTGNLYATLAPDAQINYLFATERTIYVHLVRTATCVNDTCDMVMASRDGGATWTPFTPGYQGQPVFLFSTLGDGHTLIGQTNVAPDGNTRTYVRSTDDGATWTPLPLTPGDLVILNLASAPDGTLYAELVSFGVATATPAVYQLSLAAHAWKRLGALPAAAGPLALAWDALRGPLALWSVGGFAAENRPARGLAKFVL